MNILQINWSPSVGIDVGFFTIRYYSLMFVIAFSLGLYLMKKIYVRDKLSLDKLDKLFFHIVIATILGARLGHVLFYDWAYYKTHLLEIFLPFQFTPNFKFTGFSGLASHGAAIVILLVLYYHSKKILKKPFLFLLDRMAIVVALGAGFVRIGNLMNSEIIGKKTNSALGFVFKNLGEDFTRHPAQLYESLGYFALFFLLWRLYLKTNITKKKGVLFGIFMFVMWSLRFLIEFIKEPQKIERADWLLNTGQLLSIPFIFVGIYFILRQNFKYLKRIFLILLAVLFLNCGRKAYFYARKELNFSKKQARNYADEYDYAHIILNYQDKKAKYYAYAQTKLDYFNAKSEKYAYAKYNLGYNDKKASDYAKKNFMNCNKKAYAYAIKKLNFSKKQAKKYANEYVYAHKFLIYPDKKAKYYAYAHTKLNYFNAKSEEYAYARYNLGYNDKKAKDYANKLNRKKLNFK